MRTRILRPPYLYATLGVFALYSGLNIIISEFYVTVRYIPHYLGSIHWAELLFSWFLFLVIGLLLSMNLVSLYVRHKERRSATKEGVVACAAMMGGLATGVCSACVTGFIPLALSAAGLSAGFAALPFKGIEVQAGIAALLGANLYAFTRGA